MEKPVFNFLEPKKKRFVYGFETGPFPVPIETLTGVQNSGRQWSYYQGRLNGNSVLVESLQEMEALYQMGFFGKGNLSWSSPDYNVAVGKDRRVVKKKSDETFLRLMSRRRYMKHSEWQERNSSACHNERESGNGKDIEDQTDRKQGLDETQSTSLSSSSCPQSSTSCPYSSTSCPQSSTICPQPSSTTEQECSSGVFEDEDGDTLLVEDSEEDEGDVSIPKNRLKESVARDPFPLRENLQLGLEEAFFLSYGLGCLVVTNGDKGPMNLTEMWEKFQDLSPSFITHYVAYHNFRSKGWVVKTGIKYGVDFVLYKKGLPFYHSSYSVVVIAVNEGSEYEENVNFDWTSLCCTNRVTEQVSKELMFCYVVRPTNLSDEELRSPRCISKFKIAEVIVRRWISKKERENAEYLEIP